MSLFRDKDRDISYYQTDYYMEKLHPSLYDGKWHCVHTMSIINGDVIGQVIDEYNVPREITDDFGDKVQIRDAYIEYELVCDPQGIIHDEDYIRFDDYRELGDFVKEEVRFVFCYDTVDIYDYDDFISEDWWKLCDSYLVDDNMLREDERNELLEACRKQVLERIDKYGHYEVEDDDE